MSETELKLVICQLILFTSCSLVNPTTQGDRGLNSEKTVTTAELAEMLGQLVDGWEPTPLRGLRSGMSPGEAATVIPGADQLGPDNLAVVTVSGPSGLNKIRMQFGESKKLSYVDLYFATDVSNSPGFSESLQQVCLEKFGKPKRVSKEPRLAIEWSTEDGWALLSETQDYPNPRYFYLTVTLP